MKSVKGITTVYIVAVQFVYHKQSKILVKCSLVAISNKKRNGSTRQGRRVILCHMVNGFLFGDV
jgi:hypothetical protein